MSKRKSRLGQLRDQTLFPAVPVPARKSPGFAIVPEGSQSSINRSRLFQRLAENRGKSAEKQTEEIPSSSTDCTINPRRNVSRCLYGKESVNGGQMLDASTITGVEDLSFTRPSTRMQHTSTPVQGNVKKRRTMLGQPREVPLPSPVKVPLRKSPLSPRFGAVRLLGSASAASKMPPPIRQRVGCKSPLPSGPTALHPGGSQSRSEKKRKLPEGFEISGSKRARQTLVSRTGTSNMVKKPVKESQSQRGCPSERVVQSRTKNSSYSLRSRIGTRIPQFQKVATRIPKPKTHPSSKLDMNSTVAFERDEAAVMSVPTVKLTSPVGVVSTLLEGSTSCEPVEINNSLKGLTQKQEEAFQQRLDKMDKQIETFQQYLDQMKSILDEQRAQLKSCHSPTESIAGPSQSDVPRGRKTPLGKENHKPSTSKQRLSISAYNEMRSETKYLRTPVATGVRRSILKGTPRTFLSLRVQQQMETLFDE